MRDPGRQVSLVGPRARPWWPPGGSLTTSPRRTSGRQPVSQRAPGRPPPGGHFGGATTDPIAAQSSRRAVARIAFGRDPEMMTAGSSEARWSPGGRSFDRGLEPCFKRTARLSSSPFLWRSRPAHPEEPRRPRRRTARPPLQPRLPRRRRLSRDRDAYARHGRATATAAPTPTPAPTHTPGPTPAGVQYLLYDSYESLPDDVSAPQALLIKPDGTGAHVIVQTAGLGPLSPPRYYLDAVWSHDGSVIHITTYPGACVPHLSDLPIAGGPLVPKVTMTNHDWKFLWSPNDSQIAYRAFPGGRDLRAGQPHTEERPGPHERRRIRQEGRSARISPTPSSRGCQTDPDSWR